MDDEAQQRITKLEKDVERLTETLRNLIAWTAQSAGSPISRAEAVTLLENLPT